MTQTSTPVIHPAVTCPAWCRGDHQRDKLVPDLGCQGEWYALHSEAPVVIDSGERDLPEEARGELLVELQHWANHVTPEQPWTLWLKKTDIFGEEVDLVLTARQALLLAEVLQSQAARILAEETTTTATAVTR